MSHTTVKIKAGNDAERTLPDTEATMNYIHKLSAAATVRVSFDTGEVWEVECGKRKVVAI